MTVYFKTNVFAHLEIFIERNADWVGLVSLIVGLIFNFLGISDMLLLLTQSKGTRLIKKAPPGQNSNILSLPASTYLIFYRVNSVHARLAMILLHTVIVDNLSRGVCGDINHWVHRV